MNNTVTASRVLLLLSVLTCLLAAFGVTVGVVALFPLGVALGFAAFLV